MPTTGSTNADAIPVVHTPDGGFGDQFPAPILGECTEPVVAGAPDLAGMWRVVVVTVEGVPVADHPVMGHVQRVEQCGNRLIVTGGGVIHDMRVDGTAENGVNDIAADLATPIQVAATYESGVHVLRPVGIPVEVTRRREGPDMIWSYVGFVARLERLGSAVSDPPVDWR